MKRKSGADLSGNRPKKQRHKEKLSEKSLLSQSVLVVDSGAGGEESSSDFRESDAESSSAELSAPETTVLSKSRGGISKVLSKSPIKPSGVGISSSICGSSSGEEPALPAATEMMLSYDDSVKPITKSTAISPVDEIKKLLILKKEGDEDRKTQLSRKKQAEDIGREESERRSRHAKSGRIQRNEDANPSGAGPAVLLEALEKESLEDNFRGGRKRSSEKESLNHRDEVIDSEDEEIKEGKSKGGQKKHKSKKRNERVDEDPNVSTHDLNALVFGSGVEADGKKENKFIKEVAGKYADFTEDVIGSAEEIEEHPPAWEDDEDTMVNIATKRSTRKLRIHEYEKIISGKEYERRAREQFKELMPTVAWKEESNDMVQADETVKDNLDPTHIGINVVRDFNMGNRHKSVVSSVDFHPTDNLLLTAGPDKKLNLFQFDGKTTSLLESIFIHDMPIYAAKFTADGKEIIMSGRKPFFYTFELSTSKASKVWIMGNRERSRERLWISPDNKFIVFGGTQGAIVILDRHSHRVVKVLKISGNVDAVCFAEAGSILYAAGRDAEIYKFSLKTFRCLAKRLTECLTIQAMCVAEKGRSTDVMDPLFRDGFIAVGGKSGIVTLFPLNFEVGRSEVPLKPLKVFTHLTTPISTISLHPTGSIMLICSKYKMGGLRLINMRKGLVYGNWPRKTPLGFVYSVAFSRTNTFLALGSDKGNVLMYKFD